MLFRNILSKDLIRIPLATVIFIAAAFLLIAPNSYLNILDDTFRTIGAVICMGALVYSITLYTNIRINL